MTTEFLMTEVISDEKTGRNVGWVQLNRPKAYNALCHGMMTELQTVLTNWDTDPTVGAIVLTGNEKAFAAGADIKELADHTPTSMQQHNPVGVWEAVSRCQTPTIAAVRGLALGGGCELMMMCDIVIASETAKFSQPEISIGVMPGAGATQRLTRVLGKPRAMQLMLTGQPWTGTDAYEWGLVSQLVADDAVWETAKTVAMQIANQPAVAVQGIKQAILQADETSLSAGLAYERNLFHLTFASADKAEGMAAFMDKRPPQFTHR